MEPQNLIVVRGGGDIATGTICRLHRCGYKVLVLEIAQPRAIRRTVSLAEAVYSGSYTVEGVTAVLADNIKHCDKIWQNDAVAIIVDPKAECLQALKPLALVDAVLAKKNLGTTKDMAAITIALGPGFSAGEDVDAVIETARGHNLGRVIYTGPALPNTGIPGSVGGYSGERVIYAENSGTLVIVKDIGSIVKKGEVIATIDNVPVYAPFEGVIRGMIPNNSPVKKQLKIADIDPRLSAAEYCLTISDKARCISGGVLEAILFLQSSPSIH